MSNSDTQRSRARDRSAERHKASRNTSAPGMGVMPFGKHKGRRIEDIPADYLKWMVATLSGGWVTDRAAAVLAKQDGSKQQSAGKQFGRKEKPPRKPTDLSRSHYEWSHPKTGRRYRIPNDVAKDGRENEECPFDVEEPVLLWSPECDGDREFMDIIR